MTCFLYHEGLLEKPVLLAVVAELALPDLLHQTAVGYPLGDAGVLHHADAWLHLHLLQEDAVAETEVLIQEELKLPGSTI